MDQFEPELDPKSGSRREISSLQSENSAPPLTVLNSTRKLGLGVTNYFYIIPTNQFYISIVHSVYLQVMTSITSRVAHFQRAYEFHKRRRQRLLVGYVIDC